MELNNVSKNLDILIELLTIHTSSHFYFHLQMEFFGADFNALGSHGVTGVSHTIPQISVML